MTREELLNVAPLQDVALLQATEKGLGFNLAKFADVCIEGATNKAINKACEWLKNYAHVFVSETTGDLNEVDLIDAFRKAMKGE